MSCEQLLMKLIAGQLDNQVQLKAIFEQLVLLNQKLGG